MENLYKVVKIEGKSGLTSIIALQDIEIGTLILREEFQCVPSLAYRDQSFTSLMADLRQDIN